PRLERSARSEPRHRVPRFHEGLLDRVLDVDSRRDDPGNARGECLIARHEFAEGALVAVPGTGDERLLLRWRPFGGLRHDHVLLHHEGRRGSGTLSFAARTADATPDRHPRSIRSWTLL